MKMKKEYHDNFANWADVLSNFNVKDIPEPDLVFAAYETPPYEGHAYVVFKDDAGWHYVYGGHCSCYGLEGQWNVESFDPEIEKQAIAQDRAIISFYENRDLNDLWKKWLGENT